MNILETVSSWANKLTEVGVSVIALGIVLEVLFKGAVIPFWPEVSVIDNVMGIIGSLSNEGLLGLVGAFVLYHILRKNSIYHIFYFPYHIYLGRFYITVLQSSCKC